MSTNKYLCCYTQLRPSVLENSRIIQFSWRFYFWIGKNQIHSHFVRTLKKSGTNLKIKWCQACIKSPRLKVNLCQKLLFLHQLHNPHYDDRLLIELQVQYVKIPSSNLGRTFCVQKLSLTFRTIYVHNMFSPCSSKIRASDKDLPVKEKVLDALPSWTLKKVLWFWMKTQKFVLTSKKSRGAQVNVSHMSPKLVLI